MGIYSLLQRKSLKILQISSFLVIVSISFLLFRAFSVNAEVVETSVTVGNKAPSFSTNPFEDPAVTSTSPASIGSLVNFKATGTDDNGEDYYLIVCSTNSVTAVNGSIPVCNGGTTYCTSTITASDSPASCSYTTLDANPFNNPWYAFVCDYHTTASACSLGNQGTGDSGSPFYVNHLPSFSFIENTSPANPGGSITWTATSSDPDGNTVKLLVCKTQSITNGACTDGAWCTSDGTDTENPECTYNIPSVYPDGTKNAFVYIVDQYNIPSPEEGHQGENSYFTIENVSPVVSSVVLNSGSAITLSEATDTASSVTATITDNNSCYGTEIVNVSAFVYRSGIGAEGCDSGAEVNYNHCYPEITTCEVVAGSCTDVTDSTVSYTCSFNFKYYADPTDINTQFDAQNWLASV